MNLGGAEILILVAIAVLLFGAGWLPKMAKNLGKAKVEMDKAQQQFNDAKTSVVEATGVKELESTLSKANKVLNTSPQKLVKDAAKTAVTGGAAKKVADTSVQDTMADDDTIEGDTIEGEAALQDTLVNDDAIEEAEIVEPAAPQGSTDEVNVTVDFDDE